MTGTLGASLQSNGTFQVTYDGSPLYTFVGDTTPGQVTGQGITGFSVVVVSAMSTTSTTVTSEVPTVSVPWPPGNPNNGQTVIVTGSGFPARSTGLTLEILECADPAGSHASLPSDPSSCDGTTASPLPIYTDAAGNFTVQYTIEALSTSGGGASNIDCNMASFCVLWVGVNYLYAFGQPGQFAFSAPFEVGGPAAAAPEAPVGLLLPFVGGSVLAAVLVFGRRRAAAKARPTV